MTNGTNASLNIPVTMTGTDAPGKFAVELKKIAEEISTSMEKAMQALPQSAGPALTQLKAALSSGMLGIDAQFKGLAETLTDSLKKSAKGAGEAGKNAGNAFAKGVKEGSDSAVRTVKEARQLMQAEYEKVAALGKVKLGALENLKTMGVSLSPDDLVRLKEALALRRLNTDATKQAFDLEMKAYKEASEMEKSRSVNRRVDAQFEKEVEKVRRQSAVDANALAEAASKNVVKNAMFEKKSLEERLVLAKMISDVSKVNGVTQDALREAYGTKAVWASQNTGKVLAKVEMEQVVAAAAAATAAREKQLGVDRVFYQTQEALAAKAQVTAEQMAVKTVAQEAAMREKQLGVDRVFYQTQEAMAAKAQASAMSAVAAAAKAQSSQATSSAAGPYSVYGGANNRDLVRVTKELDTSHKSLNQTLTDAKFAFRGLAGSVGQVYLSYGNLLPLLAGAAIGGAVSNVVKVGAEVNNTLQTIRVLSEESAGSVEGLNKQLLELARSGPFGPREVAEAMKTLSLAGLSAAEVSVGIKDVLDFAVAGNTTIKSAADVLTTVSTAFKMGAEGFGYVADVIAKTAAVSKSSVEDIGEAFKTASVINSQYGASLEDVALMMALLSNVGVKGSAAGTAARNAWKDMAHPTKAAASALKELGVSVLDVYGNTRNLVDILKDLEAGYAKVGKIKGDSLLATIYSERGGKGPIEALALLKEKAKEVGTTSETMLADLQNKILNHTGFVLTAAMQMAQTPLNQMKSVKSAMESSFVEVFDAIAPQITELSSRLKEIFNGDEFKTALQNIAIGFGNVAIAIADNIEKIALLVGAIVTFKVATAAGAFLKVLVTEVGLLSTAFTTAAASAGTLTVATAGATASSAAKLTTAGALARFLPGLGIAITAVVTAWQMYSLFTDKASASNTAAASNTSILDLLKKERERIQEVNEALRSKMSLEDLRKSKEMESATKAAEVVSLTAVTSATERLAAAKSKVKSLDEGFFPQYGAKADAKAEVDSAEKGLKIAKESADIAAAKIAKEREGYQQDKAENERLLKAAAEGRKSKTESAASDAKAASAAVKLSDAQKLVNAGEKAYGDIMAKETGYAANFTETVLSLVAARDKNNWSSEKYNEVIAAYVALQPFYKEMVSEEKKEAEAAAKRWGEGYVRQIAEEERAYRKLADAIEDVDKTINSLLRENDKLQVGNDLNLSLMGQTAEARAAAIEQQQVLNKYLDAENEARLKYLDPTVLQSKLELIEVQKLRALELSAQSKAITAWNKTFDTIESGLVSALMTGGKEGGRAARDLIAKMLILEPFEIIVKAYLQPVTTALTNLALDATGLANSVSGTGGIMGMANSGSSLYSAGSKVYDWVGGLFPTTPSIASETATVAALNDWFGTAALSGSSGSAALGISTGSVLETGGVLGSGAWGAGTETLAGALGTGVFDTGIAAAAPTLAAPAVEAAVGVAAEGIMGSIGSAVAAIPVWGWAIAGIGALLAMGNDSIPSYNTGDSNLTFNPDGTVKSTSTEHGDSTTSLAFAAGMQDSYVKAATSLGLTMAETNFVTGSNSGKEASDPQVVFASSVNGQSYQSAETQAADTAAVELAASRAVFSALQASEMPKYLAGAFDGIVASTATQEEITAALEGATALKSFHDQLQLLPWESLKDMTYATTQALVDMSGGLDALQTNLGTFYDNFYTDAEKTALLTANTTDAFAALGITMPAVDGGMRDWYRVLVESVLALDQSDAANAGATVAVLALQGAVNDLAPTFDETAQAVEDAEKAMADAAKAMQEWQDRLDVATGKTTERALSLSKDLADAADDQTRALIKQVYAAEDAAVAAQDAADAMKTLTDAIQSMADDTANIIAGMADIGKTDFQKSIAQIKRDGETNQASLDALVVPAATAAATAAVAATSVTTYSGASYAYTVPAAQNDGSMGGFTAEQNASIQSYVAGLDWSAEGTAASSAALLNAMTEVGVSLEHMSNLGYSTTDLKNVASFATAQINNDYAAANPAMAYMGSNYSNWGGPAADAWSSSSYGYGSGGSATGGTSTGGSTSGSISASAAENTAAKINAAYAEQLQSMVDAYKPDTQAVDAMSALTAAGYLIDGLDASGIKKYFYDIASAADPLTESGKATIDALDALSGQIGLLGQVAADRQTWQNKLDVLTGATTDQALQRQADLASTTDVATLAIIAQVHAQEDIAAAQAAILEKQAQAEEALAKAAGLLNDKLALQATLYELTGNKALSAATLAAQRAIELDSLDASLRDLTSQIWAAQDAISSMDTAMGAVERAVNAQRTSISDGASAQIDAIRASADANKASIDVAQKSVDSLKGIFDDITSAVKTLRGNVDPVTSMLQARSYIDMSLSLAEAGVMPNADKLKDALGVVTKDSADTYASGAEFRFAQLAQAGKLDKLNAIVGTQKTTAEQQLESLNNLNTAAADQIKAIEDARDAQLKMLDAQLKEAQDAVDVMKGIDISVMSVSEAIKGLNAAINGVSGATGNPAVPVSDRTITPGGGSGGDYAITPKSGVQSAYEASIGLDSRYYNTTAADGKYTFLDGILYSPNGASASISSLSNADALATYQSMYGADNITNMGTGSGYTSEYSNYLKSIEESIKGLPGFAVGTNYVPHDMIAKLHEGEEIVPKAWNPAAGGRGNQNTERLERLVEGLTKEVQRLQTIVNDGNKQTKRVADNIDNVTEGGNAMRTRTA